MLIVNVLNISRTDDRTEFGPCRTISQACSYCNTSQESKAAPTHANDQTSATEENARRCA